MKKIIILEGIATTGKTTLKEKLSKHFLLAGHKTLIVDEEKTLMPILHNTEKDVSLKLLNEVVGEALSSDSDVIIFDRLYFTHIFRTNCTVEDFSSIENLLMKKQVLIVLLTIEKASVGDRIFNAMKHRDAGWTEFVKKKGTADEIVKYYQDQQDRLIEFTKESKLKSIILDVTDGDYEKAAEEIIEYFK